MLPLALVAAGRAAAAASAARPCRRHVGKRRRDGCHVPSGQSIRGPAMPHARVLVHERGQRGHGTGLGDRVRVREEHVARRASRAIAEVDVRGERSGARRSRSPARRRDAADRAGKIRDDDDLVDLRSERAAAIARARPRDRGRRRRRRRVIGRAPPGRRRASALPPPATRTPAPARARRTTSALALRERTPDPVREVGLVRRRRPRRRTTSSSAARRDGHDRGPARHRLQHRQAEALVARRLDQARRAAVERGELLDLDVAPQIGAPPSRSCARERLRPSRARRRRAAARPPARRRARQAGSSAAARRRRRGRSRGCRRRPARKTGSTPFGVTTTRSVGQAVAARRGRGASARRR